MVVLLVVGAYMVGVYKTKVEYLEGGAPAQVAQVAGEQAQAPAPEEKTVLTDDEWQKVQEGAVAVQGDENAPVTIVEFTDYECPFCARFHPTMDQIVDEYGGRVAWVYRHFPLPSHPKAEPLARGSECITELGGNDAFWVYTDYVFGG